MTRHKSRIFLGLLLAAVLFPQCVTARDWQHLGRVSRVEILPDGVQLRAGRARMRVVAVNDSVIRVQLAPDGKFPSDFFWAVMPGTAQSTKTAIRESSTAIELTTPRLRVRIRKAPLLIVFQDAAGNLIEEDDSHRPMAWDGPRVHVWKRMPQ